MLCGTIRAWDPTSFMRSALLGALGALLLTDVDAAPVATTFNLPTETSHGRHLIDVPPALEGAWSRVTSSVSTVSKSFSGYDDIVQRQMQGWLSTFGRVVSTYLKPLSNIVYVILMLYGFAKLPANFMLVAGLITIFVGPFLLGLLLQLCAASLSVAAHTPVIVILIAWLFVFLRSALFQTVALAIGLDRDGDGDVDLLDIVHWCGGTRFGRFLRLDEIHAMLAKLPPAKRAEQQPILERLERIESILSGRHAGGTAAVTAIGDDAPPRPSPTKAPRGGAKENKSNGSNGGSPSSTSFLGGLSLPKWASPANAEAFAAKQRARFTGTGDLV